MSPRSRQHWLISTRLYFFCIYTIYLYHIISSLFAIIYIHTDNGERENERHLSRSASDVSLPVQHNNNFRSRLRMADSAPHNWHMYCTNTAEVVHQLIKWPRVYAEYQADGLLSVDLLPVGRHVTRRDSTTFCLEWRYSWTGSVHGPAHAQSTSSTKFRKGARACEPEVEMLTTAINKTHAVYLAVHGSTESVVDALRCLRLESLPVYVISVDCHDVTPAREARQGLGKRRATTDRRYCLDGVTQHGWSVYMETTRDFIIVRRHDNGRRH